MIIFLETLKVYQICKALTYFWRKIDSNLYWAFQIFSFIFKTEKRQWGTSIKLFINILKSKKIPEIREIKALFFVIISNSCLELS